MAVLVDKLDCKYNPMVEIPRRVRHSLAGRESSRRTTLRWKEIAKFRTLVLGDWIW